MPAVRIDRGVAMPSSVAAACLRRVLEGYADRGDLSLTMPLGAAGAAVSVPIVVAVESSASGELPVKLSVQAREHRAWFPAFEGRVTAEDRGPLECVLRLEGGVAAPFGPLGALAGRTLLGGAAEHSLSLFVERLCADIAQEVRREELHVRSEL